MEDLLHKHELVEADITAQSERVVQSNKAAEEFVEKASSDDGDGKRCTFASEDISDVDLVLVT